MSETAESGTAPEAGGYTDLRWSGAPADVQAALGALGHPDYAAEDAVIDPRVASFGPVVPDTVAGRELLFALIRLQPGAAIETPEGITLDEGRSAGAVTGSFAEGPEAGPESVSSFQGRAMLRRKVMPDGETLFAKVRRDLRTAYDAVQGLPPDDERRLAAEDAWEAFEYAGTWERRSGLMTQMREKYELTPAEVLAMLNDAARVTV